MKKVGLIVNPVAGMGGKVGLKGTDGPEIVEKALSLGAQPEANEKAAQALEELSEMRENILLVTCPGKMGEETGQGCGFKMELIEGITEPTSSEDTEKAAGEMVPRDVDLLLFAGGDGTARNICSAFGENSTLPVIGIPAGVKIHSAVYATNPRSAGRLAGRFLVEPGYPLRRAEVMDIDEEAFRRGFLSARLYGYLIVPEAEGLMQNLKVGSVESGKTVLEGIAEYVIEKMEPDILYIVGPGTTTAAIMERLNLPNNLLGVDVVCKGELVAADASERQLLDLIEGKKAKIIVTVIGGQGYLFGRGNQQISAAVIEKVGKKNIIVVAVKDKIMALEQGRLLVDTGNDQVNAMLQGYIKIITGYREELVYRLSS
ncbi:MAG: ATP-NAD kinase family protein [Bacillota bacterium]|nr:ATP-NAD kinase family protein [Bacillota bacterium]